ncbi:hypothetical protein [uncultured Roseibium sp.]|uniref:hypothetical protein n=1 Tax=uncultured Roseibium sp. TaxID=1936171 RepID=UPI0026344EA4|nr:hypothetical protein [uncultured Roseibium sp.]
MSGMYLIAAFVAIAVGLPAHAQGQMQVEQFNNGSAEVMRGFLKQAIRKSQLTGDIKALAGQVPAEHLNGLNRSVVSRWSLEMNPGQWDTFQDAVNQVQSRRFLYSGSSPFEQPVSPDAATGTYGSGPDGGGAWSKRVASWERAKADAGRLTCQAAMSQLYTLVCPQDGDCDIETAYENRCVRTLQDDDYKQCLAVEKDYVASCFDGQNLRAELPYASISAGGTPEDEVMCNAVSFRFRGDVFAASAGHCLKNGSLFSELHRSFPGLVFRLEEQKSDLPFAVGGDFAFLTDLNNGLGGLADQQLLDVAPPVLFAPTIFAAGNKISLLRHLMAKKNSHSEDMHRYWLVDRSPLCTIVSYGEDTGRMSHTCQSSRGSSGGALIQQKDGRPVLVGVHVGYSETNSNASNLGQFGSKWVLQ